MLRRQVANVSFKDNRFLQVRNYVTTLSFLYIMPRLIKSCPCCIKAHTRCTHPFSAEREDSENFYEPLTKIEAPDVCFLGLERTLIDCILECITRRLNQTPPPSPSHRDIVGGTTEFTHVETMWFDSSSRLSVQHVHQVNDSRRSMSRKLNDVRYYHAGSTGPLEGNRDGPPSSSVDQQPCKGENARKRART
jgi:hypothetical protein